MAGQVQNLVCVIKTVLGAVAVVQIPVNNHDPFHAEFLHGPAGTNGHVIEQAEPHGLIQFCMMTRRAHRAERVVNLPLLYPSDTVD